MDNTLWILFLLMPLFAFLYSSVGHGGASSYIMMLTLFHFAPEHIRPSALVLNIIISGIAFYSFWRACDFPYKLFFSLVASSIPAAYLGGSFTVNTTVYRYILGILLLFPTLRLFNVFPLNTKEILKKNIALIALLGITIGFVSGLIGIGGGILLSPVLLMLGWTDVKETSAVSALFILVNSIAGLASSTGFHFVIPQNIMVIMPLTIVGGILGAYYGSSKFNIQSLKYLLGVVLLIASAKFLIT